MIRAALVCWLVAQAAVAWAAEPACFPERTVLQTTALVDAAGRPIGTIRGGRQVRVLADRVGSDGAHAEISIAQPVRVRGFVPREALRVFLRRDLSIERDRSWWTAGTPLQIFGGDARRAEVRRDEANRLTVPQPLRCGLLVGTVGSHDVLEDPCHCRVVSPRAETSGAPVWWRDPPPVTVEMGRGYPRVQIENQLGGWLLERKGPSVLVEFVDVWNHLRVRRWVSADGMKMGDSERSMGKASLCIPADQPLGQHGARLTRAVPLGVAPGAEPFTQLPPGTEYRVLEVAPPNAQIVARWPDWAIRTYTLDVRGWVPAALLPVPPDARPSPRAVAGRVVLGPGIEAKRLATLVAVTRSTGEGEPTFRADVGADGRFVLPIETLRPPEGQALSNVSFHRVEVTSAAGDLAGIEEEVPALPGGANEVAITVRPTVEVRGHVESRTGAWIPGEPLKLRWSSASGGGRASSAPFRSAATVNAWPAG